MSEPFLAEITAFGGNFAPRGWAFCDGQVLAISQYNALFSLLGTIYGGDGRTTFNLPDLRGRTPIGAGSGPGLRTVRQGEKSGSEQYFIQSQNLPAHTHTIGPMSLPVSTGNANEQDIEENYLATTTHNHYHNVADSTIAINAPTATESYGTGGSSGLSTYQPSQAVHYIIALVGVYPSRS